MKKLVVFIFLLACSHAWAQKDSVRVLIINAHPDDESGAAATIYKITHELNGAADLAVITNGEAGYKYSTLAEPIYGVNLTDEKIGRKYLPAIRKSELLAAGKILGIGNIFFLDQQDNHYTLDVDTVLREVWDTSWVKNRLHTLIQKGNYNYIFCLLPQPSTHGHHKGATILALETVKSFPENSRPVILGVTGSSKTDTTQTVFTGLANYPITTITAGKPEFAVDKTKSFGYKDALNYKVVVNLSIAEHKSQGTILTYMGRGDYENFWFFDVNDKNKKQQTENLFKRLNESLPTW